MAHDPQVLQTITHALRYEAVMLSGLTMKLATDPPGDELVKNALVEAWVVHVRVLADFLRDYRAKPADVVASDYLSAWAGADPLTAHERGEVNARLAHLSSIRAWPYEGFESAIARRVLEGFKDFVDQLDATPPNFAYGQLHVGRAAATEVLNSQV